jgi:ElaB/YqjD/DUF883 family membrane-anchored ribosome-binding protein
MKNRIADTPFAQHVPRRSTAPTDLLQSAQTRFNQGRKWIETYVQEHPAAGIGAALCIGVLIGWFSKRR